MATLTKIPFSGSTHGKGVKIAATAITAGTTIHTASSTTTAGEGDTVTIYGYNSNTTAETLVLGWGGTTDPDDLIKYQIPAGETHLVVSGLMLRNSLVVKGAADTANKVVVFGTVTRAA